RQVARASRTNVEQAVRRALAAGRLHGTISRPSEGLPTGSTLRRTRQRGFHVATVVDRVAARRRGRVVHVSCGVTGQVTGWAGADHGVRLNAEGSAAARGRGQAVGPARHRARTILECVTAVAEEVVARQVVPYLRRFESRAAR